MNAPSGVDTPAASPDRRTARRQETKDEIIAAAWDLVREEGLAGLAMRDLGKRVGMKAQSIYSYFASKHEIYDAMFHEGYLAFARELADVVPSTVDGVDMREVLHDSAHRFFDFCVSDPVRYQLLFQRTIPDFIPSDESYAVAVETYDDMRQGFERFGVTDPEVVDLWTALLTGLSDQQISNDPGGDRWERVIDRAVGMFLTQIDFENTEPNAKGKQ